ncbi:MAG: hypothetical protein J1F36_05745 [Clostridiales bacterium]|nr:hypothetical protein [Clostridiales bacterium]
MLTKKDIANTLGLSCVEKYFLAWLKKYFDVSQLYGCSFVSLSQVFDDFARGATYQNYCYLPRLQDTAEEYGIVTHRYKTFSSANAIEFIRGIPDGELCFIRVNSAFFTDYKRAAWREDHYISIDSKLEWVNEYPLSTGAFDSQSFARVFDGAICIYSINNTKVELPDLVTKAFATQNFSQYDIPRSLDQLESAIGVLRVTRKRLEKFFASNDKVRMFLSEENVLLDKIYFNSRLHQLKDKSKMVDAHEDIIENIKMVVDIEKRIAEVLSK